ncbi:MAG: glycosyltransferase [Terriglobales bacterium]
MSAPRRILYIAYPMLPVSRESCGGAEQMLWTVEAEMARRGHRTTVAACDGSNVSGEVFATGAAPHEVDAFAKREAQHTTRIFELLERERFDLVHDHSGCFWRHALSGALSGAPALPGFGRCGSNAIPLLATLHLPRSMYPADAFSPELLGARGSGLPAVFFNCVSESQLRTFHDVPQVLGVVRNGIRLELFPAAPRSSALLPGTRKSELGTAPGSKRRARYLLWLGRICEEKGTHVAIEVARRSGLPLVIAGDVYRFSYHQAYFEREVRPHLHGNVYFVQRPSAEEKLELLRGARALLITSLIDETSSLVAMEAMACGTPVVAFRRGALPEVVRDGVTGILTDTPEQMSVAIERAGTIDPAACRAHVEENFPATRMADDHERLYDRLTTAADVAGAA